MRMKLGMATLALIERARGLCEGTDNAEYVRGQAELIAQFIDCEGDAGVYHEAIEVITSMLVK